MVARFSLLLTLLLLVAFVTAGRKFPVKKQKPFDSRRCGGKFPCLIFEDEFDKLDFKTWQHEFTAGGGGNWEFQYYTNNRSNSYVKNGILHLKPTLAEDRYGENWVYSGTLNLWGGSPADLCTGNQWYGCERQAFGSSVVNPIQSARLRTAETFAFRYGRLEVEAKLPRGDWIWPAIWLLPKKQPYGGWPASGEIDLMESRGNEDLRDSTGTQVGVKQFGSTLHYGPHWPDNGFEYATKTKNLENGRSFADDFHTYRLDWDENGLRFYIDDELLQDVGTDDGYWKRGKFGDHLPDENNVWAGSNPDAPFDQEFYLILNVAVGGTGGYWPDSLNHPSYPKPWSDASEMAMRQFWDNRNLWLPTWPSGDNEDDRAMQINSIRVWKLKEDCFVQGTCQ